MRSSSARRKVKLVLTFRLAHDNPCDDSGSYNACVVAKFSGDRHTNYLVEVGLKIYRNEGILSPLSKSGLKCILIHFLLDFVVPFYKTPCIIIMYYDVL